MYIKMDIQTELEIRSLVDLPKIKSLMENLNMTINKSQLAREMGVDRRTINKYLEGFTRKTQGIRAPRSMNIMKLLLPFYQQNPSKCSTTNGYCGNT